MPDERDPRDIYGSKYSRQLIPIFPRTVKPRHAATCLQASLHVGFNDDPSLKKMPAMQTHTLTWRHPRDHLRETLTVFSFLATPFFFHFPFGPWTCKLLAGYVPNAARLSGKARLTLSDERIVQPRVGC